VIDRVKGVGNVAPVLPVDRFQGLGRVQVKEFEAPGLVSEDGAEVGGRDGGLRGVRGRKVSRVAPPRGVPVFKTVAAVDYAVMGAVAAAMGQTYAWSGGGGGGETQAKQSTAGDDHGLTLPDRTRRTAEPEYKILTPVAFSSPASGTPVVNPALRRSAS